MSVVDLEKRLTQSWRTYHAKVRDTDSYIFVGDVAEPRRDSPVTLELSVGTQWLNADEERFYAIPEDGLRLKPRQLVIVETQENIATPFNVFGLVTGRGSYIFRGMVISSGKIDPGFRGKLRIGIYNGSRKSRQLNTGSVIALAYFLRTDLTLSAPMAAYETFSATQAVASPPRTRLWRWLRVNWLVVAPLLVSIASLFVAILRGRH